MSRIRSCWPAARAARIPVLWLNQSLPPDDSLFEMRTVHCLAGSWGAQVVDELPVEATDIVIPKRRYSGFFQTTLDLTLRERGIDTVIVTGVVTNICVRSTVHDAFFLSYKVLVPGRPGDGDQPPKLKKSRSTISTRIMVM